MKNGLFESIRRSSVAKELIMVLEPETKKLLKALQMEINRYQFFAGRFFHFHLVFLLFFPARIYNDHLSKISEKKELILWSKSRISNKLVIPGKHFPQ